MKKLVNGKVHEFSDVGALEIRQKDDLFLVKTSEGWKSAAVVRTGGKTYISFRGRQYIVAPAPSGAAGDEGVASGELRAPLPGVVVSIKARVGESVRKGAPVLILEAMKTQIPLSAPFDSVLQKLLINEGEAAKAQDLLAVLEESTNT